MDPWLWITVAVFVPNFIGLIIYLIVRQSVKNACVNCGKGIQKEFKICPYCGQNQEIVCENCKKAVAPDWSTCPYCAHPLPGKKSLD
jgi:RNA polymerase subunit RPABC4/transcription elongation factor Spt4